MLTENSKLIPFVMLEVLIHFYWKNLYICHIAPGMSEVGFVLLQGEVCFAPSSTGGIHEANRVCVGFRNQGRCSWGCHLNTVNCICDLSFPWQHVFHLHNSDTGKWEIQASLLCLWGPLLNDSIIIQCWWKRLAIEFLKILKFFFFFF